MNTSPEIIKIRAREHVAQLKVMVDSMTNSLKTSEAVLSAVKTKVEKSKDDLNAAMEKLKLDVAGHEQILNNIEGERAHIEDVRQTIDTRCGYIAAFLVTTFELTEETQKVPQILLHKYVTPTSIPTPQPITERLSTTSTETVLSTVIVHTSNTVLRESSQSQIPDLDDPLEGTSSTYGLAPKLSQENTIIADSMTDEPGKSHVPAILKKPSVPECLGPMSSEPDTMQIGDEEEKSNKTWEQLEENRRLLQQRLSGQEELKKAGALLIIEEEIIVSSDEEGIVLPSDIPPIPSPFFKVHPQTGIVTTYETVPGYPVIPVRTISEIRELIPTFTCIQFRIYGGTLNCKVVSMFLDTLARKNYVAPDIIDRYTNTVPDPLYITSIDAHNLPIKSDRRWTTRITAGNDRLSLPIDFHIVSNEGIVPRKSIVLRIPFIQQYVKGAEPKGEGGGCIFIQDAKGETAMHIYTKARSGRRSSYRWK